MSGRHKKPSHSSNDMLLVVAMLALTLRAEPRAADIGVLLILAYVVASHWRRS